MTRKTFTLFDPALVAPAIADAFRKLNPAVQWRNPVMFVVYVGSILTTILWLQALGGQGEAPAGFILTITIWLWFTILFANFAEALAEGRSKAQAASLRGLDAFDLGGYWVTYRPGSQAGSKFVDLSIVNASGRVTQ